MTRLLIHVTFKQCGIINNNYQYQEYPFNFSPDSGVLFKYTMSQLFFETELNSYFIAPECTTATL